MGMYSMAVNATACNVLDGAISSTAKFGAYLHSTAKFRVSHMSDKQMLKPKVRLWYHAHLACEAFSGRLQHRHGAAVVGTPHEQRAGAWLQLCAAVAASSCQRRLQARVRRRVAP